MWDKSKIYIIVLVYFNPKILLVVPLKELLKCCNLCIKAQIIKCLYI